jgi:superfamily I DNA/RNA helicase
VSVFNGPAPEIVRLNDESAEERFVGDWLNARRAEGMQPEEMAIFVRSPAQLDRGEKAARAANLRFVRLSEEMSLTPDLMPVCTMHLAKGLEFRRRRSDGMRRGCLAGRRAHPACGRHVRDRGCIQLRAADPIRRLHKSKRPAADFECDYTLGVLARHAHLVFRAASVWRS